MPRLQAIEDETLEKEPALLLPSDLQGRKEKKDTDAFLVTFGHVGFRRFYKRLSLGIPRISF